MAWRDGGAAGPSGHPVPRAVPSSEERLSPIARPDWDLDRSTPTYHSLEWSGSCASSGGRRLSFSSSGHRQLGPDSPGHPGNRARFRRSRHSEHVFMKAASSRAAGSSTPSARSPAPAAMPAAPNAQSATYGLEEDDYDADEKTPLTEDIYGGRYCGGGEGRTSRHPRQG
ncbi:hypothetical protein FJT64_005353 [Amphibalanus amphitrite]|uniref:Uncharacterized protein n=1 Tax=Amphibalanus amphitrite TaxID=1232801 RepID=A0A6A4VW99_AMPAM|nr:hypothetical protein FJT64_005353 [Amphibalanus amphitrite]